LQGILLQQSTLKLAFLKEVGFRPPILGDSHINLWELIFTITSALSSTVFNPYNSLIHWMCGYESYIEVVYSPSTLFIDILSGTEKRPIALDGF